MCFNNKLGYINIIKNNVISTTMRYLFIDRISNDFQHIRYILQENTSCFDKDTIFLFNFNINPPCLQEINKSKKINR